MAVGKTDLLRFPQKENAKARLWTKKKTRGQNKKGKATSAKGT